MSNYQSQMSERVLERIRKRRKARWVRVIQAVWALAMLTTFAAGAWQSWAARQAANAPTWADFVAYKPSDVSHEYVRGFDSSSGAPLEITVNGERWSLVLADRFSDVDPSKSTVADTRMAETDCAHKVIAYIAAEDPMRLRINLMHEVFHAGACLHGGAGWWNSPENGRVVHPGIYHLGEFMATFAHDNPQFMEWEMANTTGAWSMLEVK